MKGAPADWPQSRDDFPDCRPAFGTETHIEMKLNTVIAGIALGAAFFVLLHEASGSSNHIAGLEPEPSYHMGFWIWTTEKTHSQACQMWKAFKINSTAPVTNATLWITADDEFTVFLDGRELGSGAEWKDLFAYDVTSLLDSGDHVLAVEAYNQMLDAGMTIVLKVNYANGSVTHVISDDSWRIVPDGVKRWKIKTEPDPRWINATVVAPFGSRWWTSPRSVIEKPLVQAPKLAFWQRGWFQAATWSICIVITLFCLRLVGLLALHRKEEWLLRQERMRIAREIHDDIGSGLTQLVLNGEVAQRDLPHDSNVLGQLIKICDESRRLLASMDEILWTVDPQWDTPQEFVAYASKYAEEFLKTTSIQCFFDVPSETKLAAFNLPVRRSLLAAVKEALNNAVKHSNATQLHFGIRCEGQKLLIVIQDNGKGCSMADLNIARHGLRNMAQRLEDLGGYMTVDSQPGKGFRVEFGVPLGQPAGKLAFFRRA